MLKPETIPTKYFFKPVHNLLLGGVKIYDFPTRWQNWLHAFYGIVLITIGAYFYLVTEVYHLMKHYKDVEELIGTVCYIFPHTLSIVATMLGSRLPFSLMNRVRQKMLIRHNVTDPIVAAFPYPSTLPFNIDVQKSPTFELYCIYQTFAIGLFGWYLGNCDTIITGLMIHIKAQFLIVKNCILTAGERSEKMCQHQKFNDNNEIVLYADESGNEQTLEVAPRIQGEQLNCLKIVIRECQIHHVATMNLIYGMESTFNLMILMQFLAFLGTLCVGLYQCSLVPIGSPSFLSMFAFTLAALFQLFVYCWNGNEMTLVSLDISTAAYSCKWIGSDKDVQASLMMMINRAQRPCILTAAKFTDVSLETFTNIVKSAFSFFMVLRKVNEEYELAY